MTDLRPKRNHWNVLPKLLFCSFSHSLTLLQHCRLLIFSFVGSQNPALPPPSSTLFLAPEYTHTHSHRPPKLSISPFPPSALSSLQNFSVIVRGSLGHFKSICRALFHFARIQPLGRNLFNTHVHYLNTPQRASSNILTSITSCVRNTFDGAQCAVCLHGLRSPN